jgi:NosR/NirI family transcriptional regulator, nitrous oxide reductase regulator
MNRIVKLFCLAALVFTIGNAFGVERFPPPEFEPGYTMPTTTLPVPRAQWLEWLDVAMLFVALSLSTYFVLKKRSRRWIIGLGIFSLLYFGFYRKGCVCAIGSIQDVALAVFDNSYAVPLTVVAFFLLPIGFALFFGRSFCGSVCPQGAIQDLILLKPIKLPEWLEKTLRLGPAIYLGAAVLFAATGSAFIICEWDPFVALFRHSGSTAMLALGACFLLVGMFIGRPYCRFLCPYGAVLGWVSQFSKWHVTLSPQDCIQCALCDAACPYGAITEPVQQPVQNTNKTKLAGMVMLLILLVTLGGWLGGRLAIPLSQRHSTIRLAERVAGEDNGTYKNSTEETRAFRQTGRPVAELTTKALKLREQFSLGGRLFGAFVGLVIGAKLLSLTLSRPRPVFEPDHANCVSCGRCYRYCPRELSRLKKARNPAVPIKPA